MRKFCCPKLAASPDLPDCRYTQLSSRTRPSIEGVGDLQFSTLYRLYALYHALAKIYNEINLNLQFSTVVGYMTYIIRVNIINHLGLRYMHIR